MSEQPTKAELAEQCERLGIVLSARCVAADYAAALNAYARGYTAGCEKSYREGFDAAKAEEVDKNWNPENWQDAVAHLGHTRARSKYPALYSEYRAIERENRRRSG